METVVVVLMILVSFNFLLKLTYCKLWTVGVIAVSACLFVGLMWRLHRAVENPDCRLVI
mgnify:CR=1 FL=1